MGFFRAAFDCRFWLLRCFQSVVRNPDRHGVACLYPTSWRFTRLTPLLLTGCVCSTLVFAQGNISLQGRNACTFQTAPFADPLPTPTNWTPPATGQTQPAPPPYNGYPATLYSVYGLTAYYATPLAACQAVAAASPPNIFNSVDGPDSFGRYTCHFENPPGLVSGYGYAMPYIMCPAGYTAMHLNGAPGTMADPCRLINPALAQKPADGVCSILIKAGGQLGIDNGGGINGGDPDCAGACTVAINNLPALNAGQSCPALAACLASR